MSEDHVIISKPVREIADPFLDLVEKTYTSSFPEEERRDFSLVRKLLEEDSRFEMYALLRDGIYVGFITGWQFEGFVYAEHFAIDESARNGGIGAKAMTSFLALHEDPVVLEVEMPTEEMSKRRIGFYERLGFVLDQPFMTVSIKADKETKMGTITDIKQALREAYALKISYSAAQRVDE